MTPAVDRQAGVGVPTMIEPPYVELDALDPRGGTSGGGGEQLPSAVVVDEIVAPILQVVGDSCDGQFFDFDEDESLRRSNLAEARRKSARLTRPDEP